MFGSFVVVYLFLGGCAAGLLGLMSAWSFAHHLCRGRTRVQSEAFRALHGRCFAAGFALACLSALCLLLDLGRPERFVLLFVRPSATSVIAFGTFALAGLIASSGFLAVASNLYLPRVRPIMKAAAEVVCAVFAVAVMAYTGVYLAATKAVAFWDTPLVPVLFVCSAASMGISAAMLVAAFLRDAWRLDASFARLHVAHAATLAVEAAVLVAFLAVSATGRGEAPASLALLFSEPLAAWFVGGVCAAGLAVPLACEAACALAGRARSLPAADALCLFGGYALRFCLVSAGLH